jgi:DnaD/phage-associated family protein
MHKFQGFREGKTRLTPIPAQFFNEILPSINHLGELKLLLHIFWLLNQMEGSFRYLIRNDLINDETIFSEIEDSSGDPVVYLTESLQRLVNHGILLESTVNKDGNDFTFYFLNSPKGQAAEESIERGEWQPSGDPKAALELVPEQPNIYRLYEENIGPLTPMIAESLTDAEDTYPAQWIDDAFRIAVEKNSRNWRYIAAILNRWQTKGRYERKDRRDTEEARRRYADWEN